MRKNPTLAAALSFFVIGLGQLYNGQLGKGITYFVLAIIFTVMTGIIIGFFLLPVFWVYAICDAYRTADAINKSHHPT